MIYTDVTVLLICDRNIRLIPAVKVCIKYIPLRWSEAFQRSLQCNTPAEALFISDRAIVFSEDIKYLHFRHFWLQFIASERPPATEPTVYRSLWAVNQCWVSKGLSCPHDVACQTSQHMEPWSMLVLEVIEMVYSIQLRENTNALIFTDISTVACV